MREHNRLVIPSNCYLLGGMIVPKDFFNKKNNNYGTTSNVTK